MLTRLKDWAKVPPARLGDLDFLASRRHFGPREESGQKGLFNFSSRCHNLRPSSFWRRFGPKFGLVVRASLLCSSECHGPPHTTVLRR